MNNLQILCTYLGKVSALIEVSSDLKVPVGIMNIYHFQTVSALRHLHIPGLHIVTELNFILILTVVFTQLL